MHKAVGIHVFAGGFTAGVQAAGWDVGAQLETHNFGLDTARAMCGVECVNDKDAKWPAVEARMAFGNPRCTGFSTITSGYGDDTHGPWAKQTCDIHQMCKYAAGRYDIIVWESVQQAFSVGKPLLDYLRDEYFVPKNYRIAHVMINAATFGNAQQRKRYFFVAYRDCFKFNIDPPDISPYYPVLYDAIWEDRDRETHEADLHTKEYDYDEDSYVRLTPDEKLIVPRLPNGWDVNTLGRYDYEALPETYKFKWQYRTSDLPFSLHSCVRTNWLRPCPTLHSSCVRFIHPWHHRPLTVRELCKVMGWPITKPEGPNPAAQIAKGIVPTVGTWLAQQAALCIEGAWGQEDWQSSYNARTGEWVGEDATGAVEKTFDMTSYVGKFFDEERYDVGALRRHRFNVDSGTGRLLRPWEEVSLESRVYGGGPRVVGDVATPGS